MRRRLPTPFRIRDFSLLWSAWLAMGMASQMILVAVGWQVYAIHRNPLDLGLVGLAEFLPLPFVALPAGQLADRLPRKLVFAASLLLDATIAALLLAVSRAGATQLWPFLVLASAAGVSSAIGSPAARAITPTIVPADILASALALRSIAFQAAVVVGPAIGGLVFSIQAELVYASAIALFGIGFLCTLALHERGETIRSEAAAREPALTSLLAGIRLVRRTQVLLGAISLDLFAVLFGGAVALLPLFARDVLHVGPTGLGFLRSAPAVGALLAGVLLARRPLRGNAGRTLLIVVATFGASMVVFGLSRSFLLSFVALAVSGFADMISMNIRSVTVALATPDELRGRVTAVEMVFISASNELGAFESGLAAALLGAVPAVVAGGLATIGIAALWGRLFPELARVDRLEELRPVPVVAAGREA